MTVEIVSAARDGAGTWLYSAVVNGARGWGFVSGGTREELPARIQQAVERTKANT